MNARFKAIAKNVPLKFWVLVCLCCVTVFFYNSCATIPDLTLEPSTSVTPEVLPDVEVPIVHSYTPTWVSLHSGLSFAEDFLEDPPLAVYCLRVDLQNPTVFVEVISSPGEPTLRRTSSVVKKLSLVAAVNATPFSPVHLFEGRKASIIGLSVTNGKIISPSFKNYAALVLEAGRRARVLSPSEAMQWAPVGLDHACGGFSLLLLDSKITYSEFENFIHSIKAPRTAAGTSENGRYLYLMVIDGKNKEYSVGATFSETAKWISSFGASDALMLDGGGSSTLALRTEEGKVEVINIPIQGKFFRIERPVANHIGIRIIEP